MRLLGRRALPPAPSRKREGESVRIGRGWTRGAGYAWLAAVVALSAATAHAQTLDTNDFAIDLVTGPVLASGRIVGLGGAYTALSFGIDGAPFNPAAFGTRTLYEQDWFEYDIGFSFMLPGSFSKNDFFDNRLGEGLGVGRFLFLDLGLRLQLGNVGLGGLGRDQIYRSGTSDANITLATGNYGIARAFWGGQLVVGLGGRTAGLDVSLPGGPTLVSFTGSGLEGGVVVAPADQPWRFGAAARLPVDSTAVLGKGVQLVNGVRTAGGFVLPDRVYMPWEVQAGFAFQIGHRPLNGVFRPDRQPSELVHRRIDEGRARREAREVARETAAAGQAPTAPDPYRWLPRRAHNQAFWQAERRRRARETAGFDQAVETVDKTRRDRYDALAHQYVLITGDVLITGRTPNGIGVDAFLDQQRRPAGQDVTVALRLGAEAEPWPNRLEVRLGGYLEPNRHLHLTWRPHLTGGFDVRLFRWDLFGLLDPFDIRAGASMDLASRYFDWGIGVGFWH